jgi:hypothetical protein
MTTSAQGFYALFIINTSVLMMEGPFIAGWIIKGRRNNVTVKPSMTFLLLFMRLSVVMSKDNRGLASADKEPARIITGTGTPAEEKEEERARKKSIIPQRKRNQV